MLDEHSDKCKSKKNMHGLSIGEDIRLNIFEKYGERERTVILIREISMNSSMF